MQLHEVYVLRLQVKFTVEIELYFTSESGLFVCIYKIFQTYMLENKEELIKAEHRRQLFLASLGHAIQFHAWQVYLPLDERMTIVWGRETTYFRRCWIWGLKSLVLNLVLVRSGAAIKMLGYLRVFWVLPLKGTLKLFSALFLSQS